MSEEPVPSVPVDYDIPEDTYTSFIDVLRAKLADHPNPDNVEGRPVLAKQSFPQEPARWMYCNLSAVEDKEKTTTTLAVRDDNVYLIGFKAHSGNWYEFGFNGKTVPMIPGSTFLECDVDYRSLVGGSSSKEVKANLVKMQLGKSFAEESVNRLSGYVQEAGAPDADTKLDLARLIVMVCESARMISISNTVNDGWASESKISEQQVDYLWNWGLMSQALLGRREYGDKYIWPKKLNKIEIRNTEDALSVVQLLLNKPAPPPLQQQQLVAKANKEEDEALGQTLVEVFSVRANLPFIGTVAVFDGRRGQIIYHCNNDLPRTQEVDEVVLTGPYRAISALGGNCTVQVFDIDSSEEGALSAAGESINAGGMLQLQCWDDDSAVHVTPLTRDISTAHGPVTVTYAVLSNAVEATIQVKLRLANAGTHVYGKVTVSSKLKALDGVASVLFSRDSDHTVAVSTDDATVPLARHVLAAQLGWPLVVEATFHTAEENVVRGKFEFDPELSGEHVKLASDEQEHGTVEVKVTWSDI
ncbi:unnamed protein product [Urochloa decumbens]|uniref:DUF6598 domain-containing protein n=1 Tax=Urochloa decumbens TaxID=240449 RepID=A0ABC8VLQ4_9POAL